MDMAVLLYLGRVKRNMPLNMRKMPQIQITLHMYEVSSGQYLSIVTFI